ncbi:hypothetical protein V1478_004381 [Vespula squamosa]|uniref:Uncharacterized protein n=1 Tax=Vespula squamosa TaxID=30214 RepID=A0ABD2BH86_VESSQ
MSVLSDIDKAVVKKVNNRVVQSKDQSITQLIKVMSKKVKGKAEQCKTVEFSRVSSVERIYGRK